MYVILSTGNDDTEICIKWAGNTTEREAIAELKKLAGDMHITTRTDNDAETLLCKFGAYTIVMSYMSVQLHLLTPMTNFTSNNKGETS